ncbi:hypothetical protein N177_0728 [Lutibaculum baratangense AMV1]|uniref:Uncharacterized protein n=1 Tax=Lutibaculum baratangense AMV1 TaxID=631454 RepID=V4RNW8_9HYPH|nr:hypothetical protein N177_0728 [Lutibaculum baratangense AMV1]
MALVLAPASVALVFWILFALTYNAVTLSYAHVARSQPLDYVGRSNTLMNTVVILVTFALQYGLGLFLSWARDHMASNAYTVAFAVLVALQVGALAWCCLRGRSGRG